MMRAQTMITRRLAACGLAAAIAATGWQSPASAQTGGVRVPPGSAVIEVPNAAPDGSAMTVWTYRPAGLRSDDRIVFVMHGVQRNADVYRDNWIEDAKKHRFLLVVPEMTQAQFPRDAGYNFGNMVERQGGQPKPRSNGPGARSRRCSMPCGSAPDRPARPMRSSAIPPARNSSIGLDLRRESAPRCGDCRQCRLVHVARVHRDLSYGLKGQPGERGSHQGQLRQDLHHPARRQGYRPEASSLRGTRAPTGKAPRGSSAARKELCEGRGSRSETSRRAVQLEGRDRAGRRPRQCRHDGRRRALAVPAEEGGVTRPTCP